MAASKQYKEVAENLCEAVTWASDAFQQHVRKDRVDCLDSIAMAQKALARAQENIRASRPAAPAPSQRRSKAK